MEVQPTESKETSPLRAGQESFCLEIDTLETSKDEVSNSRSDLQNKDSETAPIATKTTSFYHARPPDRLPCGWGEIAWKQGLRRLSHLQIRFSLSAPLFHWNVRCKNMESRFLLL